jgi:hypothetical protein
VIGRNAHWDVSEIVERSLGVAELRPPPPTIPLNPVTKPSQIILDKGLVLDKESRASTLLCRSTGKTLLSGIKHQSLT